MVRRLLRVAVTGFCLLSLLACLGLGWLWWRSHRVRDAREFDRGGVRWEIASHGGRGWLNNQPQLRLERAPLTAAERREREAEREYEAWKAANRAHLRGPYDDSPAADRAHRAAVRKLEDQVERILLAAERRQEAEFEYQLKQGTPAYERSVPLAAPAAAVGVPPVLWLAARGSRRRVLRRRNRLGLCSWCGYDLRGSPSGRCSECGAVAANAIIAPVAPLR